MKKLIIKFWLANVLMGILLFVIYRIIISESELVSENGFEKFMLILEILLSIGFSLLYLAGVLLSSLTLFLNLFANIRSNFYISMLTFSGIPLLFIIYLLFIYLSIGYDSGNFLFTLIILSGIYFLFTAIQFLIFTRKIINMKMKNENY